MLRQSHSVVRDGASYWHWTMRDFVLQAELAIGMTVMISFSSWAFLSSLVAAYSLRYLPPLLLSTTSGFWIRHLRSLILNHWNEHCQSSKISVPPNKRYMIPRLPPLTRFLASLDDIGATLFFRLPIYLGTRKTAYVLDDVGIWLLCKPFGYVDSLMKRVWGMRKRWRRGRAKSRGTENKKGRGRGWRKESRLKRLKRYVQSVFVSDRERWVWAWNSRMAFISYTNIIYRKLIRVYDKLDQHFDWWEAFRALLTMKWDETSSDFVL